MFYRLYENEFWQIKAFPEWSFYFTPHFPYFDSIEKYRVFGAPNVIKGCFGYIIKQILAIHVEPLLIGRGDVAM